MKRTKRHSEDELAGYKLRFGHLDLPFTAAFINLAVNSLKKRQLPLAAIKDAHTP